jgi:serine phosphatase RsbU (regulator of sigma subunit)
LLIFIFLLLLPISLTLWSVNTILNDLHVYELAKARDSLSLVADKVSSSAHFQAYCQPIFDDFAKRIFELDESEIDAQIHLHAQMEKSIGIKINCITFDSFGSAIKTNLYSAADEKMLQYLWYRVIDYKKRTGYHSLKPRIQRIFGRNFHPRILSGQTSKVITFKSTDDPGLIYYSRKIGKDGKPESRGLFLYLSELPSHKKILQKTIEKFSKKDFSLAIELVQEDKMLLANPEERATISSVTSILKGEENDFVLLGNNIWHRKNIADFFVIVGTGFNSRHHSVYKLVAFIFASLLLIIGFFVCRKFLLTGQATWISIRFKLVILFVFAVYLPLLGLFFLSFRGLHDRRIVLENRARKGMLDVLYKLDSDFSQKEEEILATFNRFYNDRSWQKNLGIDHNRDDRLIKRRARVGLTGESFFNWLEVRNNKLEQLFCTARGASNDRVKELNRVMAQISLEKFAPGLLAPEARKTRQSDFVIRNAIENPVIGFSHFFEVPGQLVQMEFEGAFLYWYWNYYKQPVGDVVFFAANTKIEFNITDYLQKALQKRFTLDNLLLKLASFSPEEQRWIPEKYHSKTGLIELNRIASLNKRVTTRKINLDGKLYLATCFPGIKMRKTFVTCMYPLAEIDKKIEVLRSNIYYGMVLILVVAVLTGLLLTSAFLRPVGELSRGLNALRKRDTDFRVNIDNRDEFGELGDTFNQMMIEVKEMLLAGAVQQCLIPTKPPEIEGYELIIFNQMATDVGGDYADAFVLPDDKFLLVLGDVTGHGISSSILTAMVKALVFRYSNKPGPLSEMLRELSEMIFDFLKRRKLMTFCALLVDRRTGTFDLANAGHPFPFIVNKKGETRSIEHSSLPLGVSKKRSKYKEEHGIIKPGEIFMMYTDGIAEATNKSEKIFGFKRVERIVAGKFEDSTEEIKEQLLKEFWQHYDQSNLDDDLTFVILKRNKLV